MKESQNYHVSMKYYSKPRVSLYREILICRPTPILHPLHHNRIIHSSITHTHTHFTLTSLTYNSEVDAGVGGGEVLVINTTPVHCLVAAPREV